MTLKKLVIHKEKKLIDIIQETFEFSNTSIKKISQKINKICLSTIDGFEFIAPTDIIYCKANGSYTSFIIKNKNHY